MIRQATERRFARAVRASLGEKCAPIDLTTDLRHYGVSEIVLGFARQLKNHGSHVQIRLLALALSGDLPDAALTKARLMRRMVRLALDHKTLNPKHAEIISRLINGGAIPLASSVEMLDNDRGPIASTETAEKVEAYWLLKNLWWLLSGRIGSGYDFGIVTEFPCGDWLAIHALHLESLDAIADMFIIAITENQDDGQHPGDTTD